MKKIFFLLLILILSLNLFAHTKMFYGGAGAFFHFDKTYIEDEEDDYSYNYGYQDEPEDEALLDQATGLNLFAGQTTFFDHDDTDDIFMPIFDFSFGFSFHGTPADFGGVGIYTQFLGGFSFRPVSLLILNLAAGAKLTGVYGGGNILIPDGIAIDGIVDASLNFNFFYIVGLKLGTILNFGFTGFYANPYISITTALENIGLRM